MFQDVVEKFIFLGKQWTLFLLLFWLDLQRHLVMFECFRLTLVKVLTVVMIPFTTHCASLLNDSRYWNTFLHKTTDIFLISWHQTLHFCLNFSTKTDPAPSFQPCSIAKRHIFRFRSPGSVTYHIAHRATPLLSTPTGHGRPHDFSRGGQIRGPEAFVPQRGP